MTLSEVRRGNKIRIKRIDDDETRLRFLRFGLLEGTPLEVLEIIPKGPVLVRRNRLDLAIGRETAHRIEVHS